MAAKMASRLRALRLAMGYSSAAAFAPFLGVPASTVRRCEHDLRVATHRVLGHVLIKVGVVGFWPAPPMSAYSH